MGRGQRGRAPRNQKSMSLIVYFAFVLYLVLHDIYPLLSLIILIVEGIILWR